jgi:hypothetical protein
MKEKYELYIQFQTSKGATAGLRAEMRLHIGQAMEIQGVRILYFCIFKYLNI